MGFNNLQQYVTIVEFLGKTLGPDYEIVLQDLNPEHQAIVAIANGHISGRRVGGPLTDASLQMLSSRAYESNDLTSWRRQTSFASAKKCPLKNFL